MASNLACCPLGHSLAANKHHHHNHHHHHQQPWAPPATKKKYTGLEIACLWNMFCWSILSKYLQFTVNILDMLLVFPPQKRSNFFSEKMFQKRRNRACFLPFTVNIWSHDPNMVIKNTIFDISKPKAFQKYILYWVIMVNFIICGCSELFSFPAPTAKFGSKLPDQNWSAPRQN